MATTSEQKRIFNEKLRPVIEHLAKDWVLAMAIKRQGGPQGWLALFEAAAKGDKLDDSNLDGRPIPTMDDVARLLKMMDAFVAFMDDNGWTDLVMHFALNPEQL